MSPLKPPEVLMLNRNLKEPEDRTSWVRIGLPLILFGSHPNIWDFPPWCWILGLLQGMWMWPVSPMMFGSSSSSETQAQPGRWFCSCPLSHPAMTHAEQPGSCSGSESVLFKHAEHLLPIHHERTGTLRLGWVSLAGVKKSRVNRKHSAEQNQKLSAPPVTSYHFYLTSGAWNETRTRRTGTVCRYSLIRSWSLF